MKTKIETCPNPNVIVIHTDFDLRLHPGLQPIIESIHGVEPSLTWGVNRYSFSVEFGEMFDLEKIGYEVQQKIAEYFS